MMQPPPITFAGLLSACLIAAPASAQAPCTGDLNTDRVVDGNDLGMLLGAWGVCSGCVADSNRDGFVDGADLGLLLNGWGTCSVVTPSWATLVEAAPDPAVVTDPVLRQRIIDTGLAWRIRDTATQIEMLLVPQGTFQMGCSPSAQYGCSVDESPVHTVTLTKAFYLGRYEVTQAEWQATMGSNPSYFSFPSAEVPIDQVPLRPVEKVGKGAVQSYLTAASMRLPTEAEWEYACRAGTSSAFNNGSDDEASLDDHAWAPWNSGQQTRPVGLKSGNRLGLHDMHGNVMEWVSDGYDPSYYAVGPTIDPPGPPSCRELFRGGASWSGIFGNARDLRSSNRIYPCEIPGVCTPPVPPCDGLSSFVLGFRVARNP